MSRGELLFSDLDHFKDYCIPPALVGRSRPSAGILHRYYFKCLFFTNLFHILFSKKLFQFVLKLDFKNWNAIVHRRFLDWTSANSMDNTVSQERNPGVSPSR